MKPLPQWSYAVPAGVVCAGRPGAARAGPPRQGGLHGRHRGADGRARRVPLCQRHPPAGQQPAPDRIRRFVLQLHVHEVRREILPGLSVWYVAPSSVVGWLSALQLCNPHRACCSLSRDQLSMFCLRAPESRRRCRVKSRALLFHGRAGKLGPLKQHAPAPFL